MSFCVVFTISTRTCNRLMIPMELMKWIEYKYKKKGNLCDFPRERENKKNRIITLNKQLQHIKFVDLTQLRVIPKIYECS